MTGPLGTKLFIPRLRHQMVHRARLAELLRAASEWRLALISAPAGFGKTTLLAEWAAAATQSERSVAWLSLDARDDDPVSFWTGVNTALTRVSPSIGVAPLRLLQSAQPPIDAVITELLLQARLLDEHPDWVPQLHRRASRWHAQHGEPQTAIHHALAAASVRRFH